MRVGSVEITFLAANSHLLYIFGQFRSISHPFERSAPFENHLLFDKIDQVDDDAHLSSSSSSSIQ